MQLPLHVLLGLDVLFVPGRLLPEWKWVWQLLLWLQLLHLLLLLHVHVLLFGLLPQRRNLLLWQFNLQLELLLLLVRHLLFVL